jgi:hypothetical protein
MKYYRNMGQQMVRRIFNDDTLTSCFSRKCGCKTRPHTLRETTANCWGKYLPKGREVSEVWCFSYIMMYSPDHEKIPARNSIYAHAWNFAMSDELLLAILKAFIPQVNKQQTIGFQVFMDTQHLQITCDKVYSFLRTPREHSKIALTTRYS